MGVQVKLWNPLKTRAIHERFWGDDSRQGAKSSARYLYLFYLYMIWCHIGQCQTDCHRHSSASLSWFVPQTRTRLSDRAFDVIGLEQAARFQALNRGLCVFQVTVRSTYSVRDSGCDAWDWGTNFTSQLTHEMLSRLFALLLGANYKLTYLLTYLWYTGVKVLMRGLAALLEVIRSR